MSLLRKKPVFYFPLILLAIAGTLPLVSMYSAQSIDQSGLTPDEKNNIKVYQENVASVVNVSNIRLAKSFFYEEVDKVPAGMGSGFVWDDQGHIVTNFHVIRGGDQFYVAFLNDSKQYPAKVVGAEPSKDIAVLKVENPPKQLNPVSVGDSENLLVGQKALAIGNPFELDHSLSVGTISALGRAIEGVARVKIKDMIQTDAAINPGNSGGPLLNSNGEVIGMNTQIFSTSGANAGLGFAVPVNTIKRIVPQLIKHGKIIRPALGVTLLEGYMLMRFRRYFGVEKGIVVRSVQPGGAADKAGIRGFEEDRSGQIFPGDVITHIDGKETNSIDDVFSILDEHKIGDNVTVQYLREGKTVKTQVKLQKLVPFQD